MTRITNKYGWPAIDGIVCTYADKQIRADIEALFEGSAQPGFDLPPQYQYEVLPSSFHGEVAKIFRVDTVAPAPSTSEIQHFAADIERINLELAEAIVKVGPSEVPTELGYCCPFCGAETTMDTDTVGDMDNHATGCGVILAKEVLSSNTDVDPSVDTDRPWLG